MFKLTIMTGHFASEASGPQKLQKYILRDVYASSSKNRLKMVTKVRNFWLCVFSGVVATTLIDQPCLKSL